MSPHIGMLRDGLCTGDWLGRKRVVAYGAILLVLELAAFLFFVAGTHGLIVPLDRPTTTDFVSFYAAGSLADAGTPALAYDQAAHFAAEQQATAPGIRYVYFYYPPVFLLLCAALARLPYLVSFIVFEAATLVPCLFVGRRILAETGWSAVVPLLAFPAVFWNLGLGQNAFITAALFGAATLLIDRRPVAAGILFGALCYKPHFGLLIPVALAAGGHWRAFLAAALSATALVLLSLAVFGAETWSAFLAAAGASHATYESGAFDLSAFVSPFAAIRMLNGSPALAYAVQALATSAAALLVALAWRRALRPSIRAATLAAATLVAIPVVVIYDLMLAGVAMAWLVRSGRESGFPPWEKLALALLFVLPVFTRSLGSAWHVPLTPLLGVALFVVTAGRVRREIRQQNGAAIAPLWPRPERSYGAG